MIREEFKIPSSAFVIGHIGRFSYEKNHKWLIDFFDCIHAKNKTSILFLVGRGELENTIREYVSKLGLSNCVIISGPRNDIPDILSSFDAFILPSKFEGLGIVAIEAQANGLTTVCSSNVPGDVVVSDNCRRIDLSNTKEIVNSIFDNNTMRENIDRDRFSNSGFDIEQAALVLQDYYLGLTR